MEKSTCGENQTVKLEQVYACFVNKRFLWSLSVTEIWLLKRCKALKSEMVGSLLWESRQGQKLTKLWCCILKFEKCYIWVTFGIGALLNTLGVLLQLEPCKNRKQIPTRNNLLWNFMHQLYFLLQKLPKIFHFLTLIYFCIWFLNITNRFCTYIISFSVINLCFCKLVVSLDKIIWVSLPCQVLCSTPDLMLYPARSYTLPYQILWMAVIKWQYKHKLKWQFKVETAWSMAM